jgi:hypothetical protein
MKFDALTDDELVTATGGYVIRKVTAGQEALRTQVETLATSVKDAATASTTTAADKAAQSQSTMMMMMMMMRR